MMKYVAICLLVALVVLDVGCSSTPDQTSSRTHDTAVTDAGDGADGGVAADVAPAPDAGDADAGAALDAADARVDSGVADAAVDAAQMDAGDIADSAVADADTGTDADSTPVYACTDPSWTPGACAGSTITEQPDQGGQHVSPPTPITYDYSPPASGPHRPQWGKWGEYTYLPPERWVHNLEHGGIALLYNPCADQATIDALHAYAANRPDDDGGQFRWVLTPYPGLQTTIAVVAWDWVYEANCVDTTDIETFVSAHYRQAPEDSGADGSYFQHWLGR